MKKLFVDFFLLLTIFGALCLFPACSGEDGGGLDPDPSAPVTPRTDVPDQMTGDWFTGTISSIQYYDRSSGQWQTPNGTGFYIIIDDDGDYETGAIIETGSGFCKSRLYGVEVGTLEIDGTEVRIHRHWVRTRVVNTCGEDGERTLGPATRVVQWSIEIDETGREWLTFVHPDDGVERYRRWNLAD